MAGRLQGGCAGPGGILGLLAFCAEHERAVRFDLLAHGLRWEWIGTDRLTWKDFQAFIEQVPTGSAIARSVGHWTRTDDLLAGLYDLINGLMWGMSDPKKRGPQPKPIDRPGVKPQGKQMGSTFPSIEDFNRARYGSPKPD